VISRKVKGALVIGIAGLVVACEGILGIADVPNPAESDGGSDGPIGKDSRSSADREQVDSEPPATCPTTAPIDATALPWKTPKRSAGSCSPSDLEVLFVTYGGAPSSSWTPSTVQNTTCRDCVFGEEGAATWTPLLVDANGKVVRINVGGCIAIASNSDACGRAYQNHWDCGFEACGDCTESARPACRMAASKGACLTAINTVRSICGNTVLTQAETTCNQSAIVFKGSATAQCIGGIP